MSPELRRADPFGALPRRVHLSGAPILELATPSPGPPFARIFRRKLDHSFAGHRKQGLDTPAVTGNSSDVFLYADGACAVNPGPSGWAVILRSVKLEKDLSGGFMRTTNSRKELRTVIEGLKALKKKRWYSRSRAGSFDR